MSAWQHPNDRCPSCEQDIILRPDITPDLRLLYVRHCPHCDAGEPIVAPRRRIPAEELEAAIRGANRTLEPSRGSVDATAAAAMWTDATGRDASPGVEGLWNDERADDGAQMSPMDARWARFVAPDDGDDGDALPLVADGTFAFGGEAGSKHRRPKRRSGLRLRQSA